MRLHIKFKKAFLIPLIFTFIISAIVAYTIYYMPGDVISIQNNLKRLDKKKSKPIILSVSNLLYSKFQNIIYALTFVKKTFEHNRELIEKAHKEDSSYNKKDILKQFYFNAAKMGRNSNFNTETFGTFENKNFLKSGYWYVDQEKTDIDLLGNNSTMIKDLYSLHFTMPIIRSLSKLDIYFSNEELCV